MDYIINPILDFIELGGDILWVIFGVGLLLVMLLIERLWYFNTEFKKQKKTIKKAWKSMPEHESWTVQRKRDEMISKLRTDLESPNIIMKALVALLPMLGLLGTVMGMIEVFDVVSILGTGNARAMAGGVSKATIPTMAGMIIAVVGIFLLARYEHKTKSSMRKFIDKLV